MSPALRLRPLPRPGDLLLIAATVAVATLVGIYSRDLVASFWPANALLVGLLIRAPRLAHPLGWVCAFATFMATDMATGTALEPALLLNGGNMLAVGLVYATVGCLHPADRRLRRPYSILLVSAACAAASLAIGVLGLYAGPELFGLTPWEGATIWLATELGNLMAILPVVLAAPYIGPLGAGWRRGLRRAAAAMRATVGPLVALIISLALALMVGGPAALALIMPALLWCALSADVFATTVHSLIGTCTIMVALTHGHIALAEDEPSTNTMLAARLALCLLGMGPIAVAATVAARDDAMRRLRQLATHDMLTDALTRRAFVEEAERMVTELAGGGRPVAVLMLDIDRFKQINDRHGHAAGDAVLEQVAAIVRSRLREADLFGRIGGEEFAVVLPDLHPPSAGLVAERIRAAVAERRLPACTGSVAVTLSIGLAHAATASADLDGALAAADQALYRAKQGGRDRVVATALTG